MIEEEEPLIVQLMCQTFHMTDDEAKPIVDKFLKEHPEILNEFSLDFLYKV